MSSSGRAVALPEMAARGRFVCEIDADNATFKGERLWENGSLF